ncbi:ubiquinone/menaquinone biosynthesis methyltransferase [Candidatus Neomarinimicrobiota bacterium]
MNAFIHHGTGKQNFTRSMFAHIAPRYDFLNHLLTLGFDRRWRRHLIQQLDIYSGAQILDLACGTGDVAKEIISQVQSPRIYGGDPVTEMLQIAHRKLPDLHPVCLEGEHLPFPSGIFDAITVAFGLRNFAYLETGLGEIYRCLVDGGRIGFLEFFEPTPGLQGSVFKFYTAHILPAIGGIFSRRYAYRYLPESIEAFGPAVNFTNLLRQVGFIDIYEQQYLSGLVRIFIGTKAG